VNQICRQKWAHFRAASVTRQRTQGIAITTLDGGQGGKERRPARVDGRRHPATKDIDLLAQARERELVLDVEVTAPLDEACRVA
jgi:hypothetical protein